MFVDELRNLEIAKRPLFIGKFIQEYRLDNADMVRYFDTSLVPFPVVNSAGKITMVSKKDLKKNQVYICHDFAGSFSVNDGFLENKYRILPPSPSLLIGEKVFFGREEYFNSSYISFVRKLLFSEYNLQGVDFYKVANKYKSMPLFIVKRKGVVSNDLAGIESKRVEDLTMDEFTALFKDISNWLVGLRPIYKFPQTEKDKFSFGFSMYNLYNPIIKAVWEGLMLLYRDKRALDDLILGELKMLLENSIISRSQYGSSSTLKEINQSLKAILECIRKGSKGEFCFDFKELTVNSFVNGSVRSKDGRIEVSFYENHGFSDFE